jgi:phospholipid transport system substrate-binding protein
MIFRTLTRVATALLLAAAAWTTAVTPALANQDAEAFTQRVIDEGLSILRKGSATSPQFHNFLSKYADATKAALFTLGPYRRGANKADLDAFTDAYREYQFALYGRSLDKYKDKALHVTGSVENQPNDVTVDTVVQNGDHDRADNALRISFRLMGSSGDYKFTDVRIEGAWISQSQLEQFRSILGRNGGNIPDLTHEIEERTARINSGDDQTDRSHS